MLPLTYIYIYTYIIYVIKKRYVRIRDEGTKYALQPAHMTLTILVKVKIIDGYTVTIMRVAVD